MQHSNLKDKKLLYELDFQARLPLSSLARKIGLSKQGVEYKLHNLVKKRVIKGFYPVINVPKLGYLYCRLSFSMKNLTSKREQEILQYLSSHKKVFWLFTAEGDKDVLVALWVKAVREFREFVEEFNSHYGENISSKNESINTDVILYQNRFLLQEKETLEINIAETPERVLIDDIDKDILRALCVNARAPLVEIAENIGTSAKVVAYRIRRMEKEKLIEGYRPVIDYNLLGYSYYKVWIMLNNVTSLQLKKLHHYVKQQQLTLYLVKGIGFPGDLDIEVVVKSNTELYDFIKELKLAFPMMIGERRIFMFRDTLKVQFLPFE